MSCYGLARFQCSTRMSESSDMAKSWANYFFPGDKIMKNNIVLLNINLYVMEETSLTNKEEKRLYYKSLFDEAMAYELGERGFPINQQEAFKRYLACAEYYDEDPECGAARDSLEKVGTYYDEDITPPDYEKAFVWYKKSYDAGNFDVASRLGEMYEQGLGTPVDYAKAVECYRKACFHPELTERVYAIYKEKKLNDPVEEEQARIDAAHYRREQHRKTSWHVSMLADLSAQTPEPSFSKELFVDYYTHRFEGDLIKYFDIERCSDRRGYPVVLFMEMFNQHNVRRCDIHWQGLTHYYMFSSAVFYMALCTQTIGHLYGYQQMENYMCASGWPALCCGMGGVMHPIHTILESDLFPSKSFDSDYLNVLDMAGEYLVEDFLNFFKPAVANLNAKAHTELLKVVDINDLRKELEEQTSLYRNWILDPETQYPSYYVKR